MNLVIINAIGVVHNAVSGCEALRTTDRRVALTPLQARVYKLPACRECFPDPHAWAAVRAS